MTPKDTLINFRAPEELSERLKRASEILDRPYAEIIREAINEKLAKLAAKHPQLREEPAEVAA